MIRQLAGGLALAVLAAGCLPAIQAGQQGEGEAVIDLLPEPVPEGEDACGASTIQHMVGGPWPQPLPPGMTSVRAIPHGSPGSADYSAQRVNIDLSPDGRRVLAIWCG